MLLRAIRRYVQGWFPHQQLDPQPQHRQFRLHSLSSGSFGESSGRRYRAQGAPLVRHVHPHPALLGQPGNGFDLDIRLIEEQGLVPYVEAVIDSELAETFWTAPGDGPSSSTSPYFIAYRAAQARLGDKDFLSTDITVRDLLLNHGDKHHVFPRKYLQQLGLSRGR